MPLPGMQSKDPPTELTLQQASDILQLAVEKKNLFTKRRLRGRLNFAIFLFFCGFYVGFFLFFFRYCFFFFAFFLLFAEFILHLFRSVGADGLLPLGGDASQPLLGALPPLLLLDGDCPIKVSPEAEDVARALELSHFKEESIATTSQHEVEIQIDLLSLQPRLLDLRHH